MDVGFAGKVISGVMEAREIGLFRCGLGDLGVNLWFRIGNENGNGGGEWREREWSGGERRMESIVGRDWESEKVNEGGRERERH